MTYAVKEITEQQLLNDGYKDCVVALIESEDDIAYVANHIKETYKLDADFTLTIYTIKHFNNERLLKEANYKPCIAIAVNKDFIGGFSNCCVLLSGAIYVEELCKDTAITAEEVVNKVNDGIKKRVDEIDTTEVLEDAIREKICDMHIAEDVEKAVRDEVSDEFDYIDVDEITRDVIKENVDIESTTEDMLRDMITDNVIEASFDNILTKEKVESYLDDRVSDYIATYVYDKLKGEVDAAVKAALQGVLKNV